MPEGGRFIPLRGFTRPEGKHYVAICIDLDIVAQGKTQEEAINICGEMICDYVSFVGENYPDRIHEYIPRYSPPELILEYDELIRENLHHIDSDKSRSHRRSRLASFSFDADSQTVRLFST